ncbi:unnamed protein product, partial [Ixodes persulcatus]
NSALRRLKRYLEIVRVEMHPGGQAQPAAEAPVLGAELHKRFWVEDRQAVSRFLESVARENLEFHTGVAHSKLHVGDHAEPGTLALSGSAEASQKGEPRRLKPSLLISLNALLTSLDGNLSNLLTVDLIGPFDRRSPTRMKRHRGSVGQYRKQLPSLGEGMDSLLDPLNPKSGLDHWDNEHTDVRGSVLHQGDPGDGAPLKKSHAGSVPAYKKELREVNRLLLDLLTELDHRKVQWTS